MKVKSLDIRKIFATNSQQTLEVILQTEKAKVYSSVPIGTSRGKHEIAYLPVDQAVQKFQIIRRLFRSEEFNEQKDVDELLHKIDTTVKFRGIGGNLALAISSAFLKAFAAESGQDVFRYLSHVNHSPSKIPRPLCNVAGDWGKQSEVQEFLFLPVHQTS